MMAQCTAATWTTQEDPASSQPGGDAPPGALQRSRPLPSSSDAGHLALAAEQASSGGDTDGSSQGAWSVASIPPDSRGSAFGDLVDGSGAAHAFTKVASPMRQKGSK